MDAIEYFKGMRKRLCEDHLKLLPKKSVGYQTTLREMSFYDAAIKALEQEPCNDTISRQEVIEILSNYGCTNKEGLLFKDIRELPSVKPQYTDDEIQKMQDLEQAEFEKAYELGKAEGQKGDDAISRQTALNAFGLSEKTRKYGGDHSGYNTMMMYEIQDVIEGLPSVSCLEKPNRCEDAISRQAAKANIVSVPIAPIFRDDDVVYRKVIFAEVIDALPSVSTEKTGRWIPDKHPLASPHCSICNGYGYKTDAFCRTCGAKMEVEESESCKGCPNICVMYDPNMKGCKDKMEGVEE